jgi:myo-inositol 2-dehydrogenase / D-chiro-inositol 1-dehydrogenase
MKTDKPALLAGVIGSNWGRVHVAGLRKAGCTLHALMAHDADLVARIATEEQIPNFGTGLETLSACDVITIATPTASHLGYLQALSDKAILCEKPLGMTPENQAEFSALDSSQIYVSYPFPFLETAQALKQRIQAGDLGELRRICLVVGVNLPYPKSPVEWFVEDVVHPFSLLYTLFDDFEFHGVKSGQGNNMTVQFSCQGALFDILLCDWPMPGLHFDLTLVGSQNAYQLRGGFRPERGWWFEPLLADGIPVTPGEPAELNPWIEANHSVAAHFIRYLQGDITGEEAADHGLFNLERARQMEALFLPLWQLSTAKTDAQESRAAVSFDWKLPTNSLKR